MVEGVDSTLTSEDDEPSSTSRSSTVITSCPASLLRLRVCFNAGSLRVDSCWKCASFGAGKFRSEVETVEKSRRTTGWRVRSGAGRKRRCRVSRVNEKIHRKRCTKKDRNVFDTSILVLWVVSRSVEKGFSRSSSLSLAQSSTSRLVVTRVLLGNKLQIADVAVGAVQGPCRRKSSRSVAKRNVRPFRRRGRTNRNDFTASEQFVKCTEKHS